MAVFRTDGLHISPYFPRLGANAIPSETELSRAAQKKRDPLLVGKKYDRNCFFSPVTDFVDSRHNQPVSGSMHAFLQEHQR